MATALRADAQRNRGRILDAAAEAFAEVGPDVTIDEIARRAGVGHGTVFRRFPTKDALRAAVIQVRLDEMLVQAKVLLGRADAGAALEEFVWFGAECARRDRALFEGVEKCLDVDVSAAKHELHETVDKLIRRARRQGSIRRALDSRDIGALVGSAIQASMHSERPDAWRRYIQVVLDGVKP
jgi:AcrR family transcriptional regulator